jgi:hypothetical protein
MSVDRDADLFEASLMLLAGLATPHDAPRDGGADPWAAVGAGARTRLWVEFETAPAAARFADLMLALPDTRCWTRRRVSGIRRQYETFVVDVDAAEPSTVVRRLHVEWVRNVGLLFGSGGAAADAETLRARASAVWRTALLTASPKMSSAGLRLRQRNRSSVRLLLRAAQLLGVTCRASPVRGFPTIHVEGPDAITVLSTVLTTPVPKAA